MSRRYQFDVRVRIRTPIGRKYLFGRAFTKKPLESLVFPGFFHVQKKEFPLFFPYQVSFLSQNINVFLHSDSAVAFHFLGHMAINVQSKGCGMMPQILLNGLDIISAL